MVPYTPSSAVSAGDVVVIGDIPFVAIHDIAAGVQGSVAARGGTYEALVDDDYEPGENVYWDDSSNKLTQAVGSHKHFGYLSPDSDPAADGDTVEVIHAPNGTATAAS